MNKIKILIILICVGLLTNCMTKDYKTSKPMSQDEIKKLKLVDKYGKESALSIAPIKDCTLVNQEEICSLIICRREKNTETGFECNFYENKKLIN